MTNLLDIFINNLLPILLVAGAGYLLARILNPSPRPLSQVTFYVFSPCLIFTILTQSELNNGDIMRVVLFAWTTTFIIGALALLAGVLFKLKRRILAGVLITSMFMNAGNYGLSLVMFAFGKTALSYASVYFVAVGILAYTVGVIIASMGSVSFSRALFNQLKIPTLYALILAVIFMRTGWDIPIPLKRTTDLLGAAAIPSMLVLLGMQLKAVKLSGLSMPIGIAAGLRLIVSPLLALLLGSFFGIIGPARQAITTEAAMPTAVLTIVLATEYDSEPSFVTAVVFMTTLLSPLMLTPLLAFLGA